ncbi:MAG TPA: TolC family protein, partial [Armatimonadota bacterium]|nr:TolC family protein [Armatimonadota bacterium]
MLHAVVVTALALIAVGEQMPPEAVPLPPIPPEPTAQSLRLPGPTRTLTLADAVAITLAQNPQIAQARAQLAQAAGATRTARGQELPRFTALYSYQSNPEAGISGATITTNTTTREIDSTRQGSQEQPQPPFNLERFISKHVATLSLTQLLYDFGRTPALTNAARRREEAARQGVVAQVNTVVENVRDRYYALLQAEGQAGVRRADLASRRVSMENARVRFEAGAVPYGDLARATAAVTQAQADLARALANAEGSRVALNQVLGLQPSDQTFVLPATEPEPQLPPLDQLLTAAYQRRPEIAQATASVQAAT